MPRIKIANLGQAGLVKDIIAEELPPEVFTDARNIRFTSQGARAFSGHRAIFTPAPFAPTWIKAFPPVSSPLWVYAGEKKVGVFDGTAHFDISRDLEYTAQTRWQGEVFNGVGIFSNPHNPPQYWAAFDPLVKLVNLPNWPQNHGRNFLRPFKNFLIAGYIREGNDDRPFRVRWSHPAAPGTIPVSWDIADPSKLAGEIDLALTPDYVVDGLTLGDIFIVYKERSTWAMQLNLASGEVFDNWLVLPDRGMLFRDCAQAFPKGHFVVGQDDIYVHTGLRGSDQSVVEDRLRKWVYQQIDDQAALNCFTFSNKQEKEIWFCFPEAGEQYATMALIWNWVTGAVGLRELPGVPFIAGGVVDEELESDIWGSGESIGSGALVAQPGAIASTGTRRITGGDVALGSSRATMQCLGLAITSGWPVITNPQYIFTWELGTDAGPLLLSQLALTNAAGEAEARYFDQPSLIILNILPGVVLGGEYPGPQNMHAALNLDNVFPLSVIYLNIEEGAIIGTGGDGGNGGQTTAAFFPEKFSWGGNGKAGKPAVMLDAVCYLKVSGGKAWAGGSGGGGAGGTASEAGGGGGGGVGGRPGVGAGKGGTSPFAGAEGDDATSPSLLEDATPGLGFTGAGAQDSAGGASWGQAAASAPEGPNPGSGGPEPRSFVVPVGTTLQKPGVDERGSTQFFDVLGIALSTNEITESVPNGPQVVGYVDVTLTNLANDREPRILIVGVGGDGTISAEHVRTGGIENRVYFVSTGTDQVRTGVFQIQVRDAAGRSSSAGDITVTVTHGSGSFNLQVKQGGNPGHVVTAEIAGGVGPYLYEWQAQGRNVDILAGHDTSTVIVRVAQRSKLTATVVDVGRNCERVAKTIWVDRTP